MHLDPDEIARRRAFLYEKGVRQPDDEIAWSAAGYVSPTLACVRRLGKAPPDEEETEEIVIAPNPDGVSGWAANERKSIEQYG